MRAGPPCDCCNPGRREPVTHGEAVSAARCRVAADKLRGAETDPRIVALAREAPFGTTDRKQAGR